jgi:hypothetical protein
MLKSSMLCCDKHENSIFETEFFKCDDIIIFSGAVMLCTFSSGDGYFISLVASGDEKSLSPTQSCPVSPALVSLTPRRPTKKIHTSHYSVCPYGCVSTLCCI